MKDLKLAFQGFIIGIGKILPGVSGAMFAMMFGVYEKSLNIISHFTKEFKNNIRYILVLGGSVVLAIILGSGVIKYCMDRHYLYTMIFFIGMMCAGLKSLFKTVKKEKFKLSNLICALIVVVLFTLTSFIEVVKPESTLKHTPLIFMIFIVAGFLDAFATVVPGICGTALLMILGYYNTIITALSDVFNINHIGNNAFILIPFLIGMALGVYLVSMLIDYLFKNHYAKTYYSIFGFAVTSIILLLTKTFNKAYSLNEILISLVFFIVGYVIVTLLDKMEKESE